MTRQERTKITAELLRLIRKRVSSGKTNKEISEEYLISISCARLLANKISSGLTDEQILQKKERRDFGNRTELKVQISSIMDLDNALTQQGVVEVLRSHGIERKQPCVSKILKDVGYTRKRLSLVPAERNSERIINLRKTYAIEMRNISIDKLVFLDETGFNLHTSQYYGYSPINTKAFSVVKANKGVNQSLMCAIDIDGIVAFEVNSGAYDSVKFSEFITSKLLNYFRHNRDHILVMDNCRFHHCRDILRILNENRIRYKFLPPYSPQLNPIEEFFGVIKAHYKSARPKPSTILEVKSLVNEKIRSFTGTFNAYYERMNRFLEMALAEEEFI